MKKFAPLLLAGLLACTNQVMAHADHEHEYITESAAVAVGQKTVTALTKKDGGLGFGKLPASWGTLPADKVKLHKNRTSYYVVAATNEAEGKTLYILMSSEDGEVYDANFTGEFKDLKE